LQVQFSSLRQFFEPFDVQHTMMGAKAQVPPEQMPLQQLELLVQESPSVVHEVEPLSQMKY